MLHFNSNRLHLLSHSFSHQLSCSCCRTPPVWMKLALLFFLHQITNQLITSESDIIIISCVSLTYLSHGVWAPNGSFFRGNEKTLVESYQFRSVIAASQRLHPQTEQRQECGQDQVKGMTCEMKDEPWNTTSPQLYSSCVLLLSLTRGDDKLSTSRLWIFIKSFNSSRQHER